MDTGTVPEGNETAAQAATDEELFEAYLAARVQQALEALNSAREGLAAAPDDLARANQVMRRVHELRDLRAQFDAQHARVNDARRAAGLQPAEAASSNGEQATPTPHFRAAQAEQAARIMAALSAKPRTCPSCQALLEANALQCHCGQAIAPNSTPLGGADAIGAPPVSNA
jgi:hypothetical protein